MKRFVKFSVHEYMDPHPHTEMRVFQGDSLESIKESAQKWAEHMTEAYSGGPTTFEGILSYNEAFDWLKKEMSTMRDPDQQDLEWIMNTCDALSEAYL